jgi:hypothetical protein
MAHKVKFWKEGHARRKLGNSSPARAITRLLLSFPFVRLRVPLFLRVELQHLLCVSLTEGRNGLPEG